MRADSLLSEPPGKPKNTGVCSLSLPSPGDLPDPGIELVSLMSPALAGEFFTISATWEAQLLVRILLIKPFGGQFGSIS